MTKMSALTNEKKRPHGDVVRRPRTVDGIGSALRNAFCADASALPADMRAMLCTLEASSGNSRA